MIPYENHYYPNYFKNNEILSHAQHCTKSEVFHKGLLQQMWPNSRLPVKIAWDADKILKNTDEVRF